jgi:transposase
LGTTEDGNASDKTLNNELLGGVSKHMARHGLNAGAFVYVADSAFVTPDNLKIAKDKNVKFLTRLPATYKECGRAIADAVCADNWTELGNLNETPATEKRPVADYRGFETTVELYEEAYRAIVVQFIPPRTIKGAISVSIGCLGKNAKTLKHIAKRSTQALFIAGRMPKRQPKKS